MVLIIKHIIKDVNSKLNKTALLVLIGNNELEPILAK